MTKYQFLQEILKIKDKSLLTQLEKKANIERYKNGEEINEHGRTDVYLRFLIQGLVKGYLVSREGKENVTCFLAKTGEIIAESTLLDGTPSETRFLAMKETMVFSIPVREVSSLRPIYREEIDGLYKRILSQWLRNHEEIKKMLCLKTAKERYEWFIRYYPGVIDCVSCSDIAAFLNISPVTLSRIRNQEE